MKRPVHRQSLVAALRQRVVGQLHLGMLRPGDRLPSVRIAAREFGVDARLVLAAYRTLKAEGLVELRTRSGVFVASTAERAQLDVEKEGRAGSRHAEWLIDRFAESLTLGMTAPAFLECLRQGFETMRLRAVVLDRNEDQLWSTADELRRDYGLQVEAVDVDHLPKRRTLPLEVRRADVIVTASADEALREIAISAGVPMIEVSMCPDLFGEVRRLMRLETVHFVVADQRFAAKLTTTLSPPPRSFPVQISVYGRDDLAAIPANAPVYLTRLARERMMHDCDPGSRGASDTSRRLGKDAQARSASALLRRIMPDARVFSEESQRILLSFIVRTNLAASAKRTDDANFSTSRTVLAR